MFETETVGPCLVRKLKWGAMVTLAHPVATPLLYKIIFNDYRSASSNSFRNILSIVLIYNAYCCKVWWHNKPNFV